MIDLIWAAIHLAQLIGIFVLMVILYGIIYKE